MLRDAAYFQGFYGNPSLYTHLTKIRSLSRVPAYSAAYYVKYLTARSVLAGMRRKLSI